MDGSSGVQTSGQVEERWELKSFWLRFDALMKWHEMKSAERELTDAEDEFVSVALRNNSRDVAVFCVGPRVDRARQVLRQRCAELSVLDARVGR